ncbi:LPS export ABC transporter ATP-binding protein [candidate division WOR-1 bacterium RIFCSPLOWO2_02_FULL_46_20]|uniref:LPS export ABC transporter ATP-binding protein n=2 Tax=Saganbacteria TaxID=1703751 RepID=A0A1F4R4Z5_UNCSA|nr:MAG: LPS export ABC transporter ATP-binding protein [candidate division WOR-1 bacterium RIFCSPHIGHO2_02_FULL_45_12]OGC03190.1 MAG: LPS export ABC transporter ATP-binding protein [candidate division WOR-1 bacterium RIFCSPLOWO2_02_FULL_46_20]OGC09832.1 MAG: LPS export ABC transporter ATP-binding protein [candidate division WOR-1 bacterium RIFCSPLOWO2_12_FULL_45_9]
MFIKTENLIKNYGEKAAVNGVSLEVKQGEVVGLLGPNGAGKTTSFYMVVGLIRPDAGRIFLDDHEITKLPMHQRAHLGIGYLPQEQSIFRKLTVEENILALWELMPEMRKAEYEKKLVALLAELGVAHLRKQKAFTLSGGEQRRVEIARALCTNPQFLLLDEPFTGIDPKTVNDLQDIVRHLKTKGIGILITDHNVRETLAITDRSYIIHKGQILVAGDAKTVSRSEEAKKFYLGENFEL